MIKFVSDLRQVGCFLLVLRFPPNNDTNRNDTTEILLKVALNTIIHNPVVTMDAIVKILSHNVVCLLTYGGIQHVLTMNYMMGVF